jgi:hypothetical protein
MYKIRFFSNFGDSSKCKEIYERLCQTHLLSYYGEGKKVYITNDEDYSHVIILNTAMPDISHIPKENVIGLAFEPIQFLNLTQEFVDYAKKYIGKYFIGDKYNLPYVFVEHYGYMWHTPPIDTIPNKSNIVSIMVSDKLHMPGHKYRHELVLRILSERLPIDIYGRGCKYYNPSYQQLKGKFESKEPYNDYKFHIAIENVQSNHYFSEKITDSLLCGTTPIYLGCKNIDSYFPDNIIKLTGNIDKDIVLLKNILRNPDIYQKNIDLRSIHKKLSLVENIDHIFS